MTRAEPFAPTSSSLSREKGLSGPRSAPSGARVNSIATKRAGPAATFAAHLELLAREGRAVHKPAGLAVGAIFAGPRDACEQKTPVEGDETRLRIDEPSAESDDAGAGALFALDDPKLERGASLDPMVQVLGALAPRAAPSTAIAKPEPMVQPDARTPIEQLMTRLVRRIAWSGNGRTGAAHLVLGAGELEGATLTIQADSGLVRVALELPPGVDRAMWKERIGRRLAMRGLHVESVDVE